MRQNLKEALYVASSNAGKLRDFVAAAGVFGAEIAVLPGLKDISAPGGGRRDLQRKCATEGGGI